MKPIDELNLGFNDARNYNTRESKDWFNRIFLRDDSLEKLCSSNVSFLIGEKGTGKTAYAVYLSNHKYKNINASIKYVRETEYQKFAHLKNSNNLQFSDYVSIWKVIILLLISQHVIESNGDAKFFAKFSKFKTLKSVIDEFYQTAFAPEILEAMRFVESADVAAALMASKVEIAGSKRVEKTRNENRFQINLMYLERQFEDALRSLKLEDSPVMFLDGIDIRPDSMSYGDYLECVKGLANAVTMLNDGFFANIKDSNGRFRVVLLVRPDIFNSMELHNSNSLIRDNSVLLDWRTTYPSHRNSGIFRLIDRLLSAQQDDEKMAEGAAWDYYFPFDSPNKTYEGEDITSFIGFLRFSFYRPRDIVTLIKIIKEHSVAEHGSAKNYFSANDFDAPEVRRKYSTYLLGEIKEHLEFYYSSDEYRLFLRFFGFLKGKRKFSYEDYLRAYSKYDYSMTQNSITKPKFCETHGNFLQFLYDLNVVCYFDYTDVKPHIRWCFRDRSPAQISPEVRLDTDYEVHYGLAKALNLGREINYREDIRIGTVIWFNEEKGYGFIRPDDGEEDIFVHMSVIKDADLTSLEEGQRVSYDIGPGKKGKLSVTRLKLETVDK